ncbi:MAG: gamma carbonic anhydrase family protein [Thermoplasmataceae archaeon]
MIKIGNGVYIAKSAIIIGNVELKDGVSIFENAVLRADFNSITIGENSNVQDNVTIHVERNSAVVVGRNVSIGHNAVVHGATIDDNVIIGMGSIILNGAHISTGSIVAAGSVVKENFSCGENSLLAGVPAAVKRIGQEIHDMAEANGKGYQILRDKYINGDFERKTGL